MNIHAARNFAALRTLPYATQAAIAATMQDAAHEAARDFAIRFSVQRAIAAASGVTRLADVIVPDIWMPYRQQITEEKSRLISAGIMQTNAAVSSFLAGPGLTFNVPNFKDLDNDSENISNDDPDDSITPNKIGTAQEIGVRLSRNNAWSSMDLTADLLGADPLKAIGARVGAYWARRLQVAFVATMMGVFADNDAAPTGTEHVAGDLTLSIAGGGYDAGVTDFSAEAMIDAAMLMGDSAEDLTGILVHSVIYGRMLKNNLIDFIPDAVNPNAAAVPSFLGRRVVVDDGMPNPAGVGAADTATGIYHTWLFGTGAVQFGQGAPKVPTAVVRDEKAGNGGGMETLHDRLEWCIHPVGHAYVGTPPVGGPSNAATANNLAHVDSWKRVYSERKQIKIARLITRES